MSSKQAKDFLGFKEMTNYKLVVRQLSSELLGSFLYLALASSAGIGTRNQDDSKISQSGQGTTTLIIALGNGLLVASLIAIFGHMSGGHMNPAVTCGALICKHIKPIKALCYIIVQVIGSILGTGVAYLLSSETIRGDLGITVPYKDLRVDQIFGFEFMLTFVMVAVFLSVIDMTRGARGLGSAPLAVGLCITAGICCCSPYTSCMNPIRSLGPAFLLNVWEKHWIYWVATISGGLVAGLLCRFVLVYLQTTILLQASPADLHRMLDGPRTE